LNLYSSERGVALLMVVLVVTLLTAVIVDFSFRSRLDARLAANVRDQTIAASLARSGYEVALALLMEDAAEAEAQGGPPQPTSGVAVSELIRRQRDQDMQGSAGGIDSLQEGWARMDLLEIPLGENQQLRVEVSDLAGRINLNAIISRDEGSAEKLNKPVFEQFVTLIDQSLNNLGRDDGGEIAELSAEDIAYAIADWVDGDEIRLSDGSFEDQYYNSLEQAYSSKNGPFDSVAELQLVEGVDDDLYAALRNSVTVYPFEGGGGINVNTAPESVLKSIRFRENQATASPEPLGDDGVARIVEAREEGIAITSLQELLEVLGFEASAVITPAPIFASNYFLIRAAGLVDESVAHLEVVVDRSDSVPRVLYWRSE